MRELGFERVYSISPNIDEKAIGERTTAERARELVLEVGLAKAAALLPSLRNDTSMKGGVLLTGDQVVVSNGKILEKPESKQMAKEFLSMYSDNQCSTIGSVILTDISTGDQSYCVDTATLHFGHIPAESIDLIVETEAVMYCCGALMSEHPVLSTFIQRLDGEIDSVLGLRKKSVMELLDILYPTDI